MFVVLCLFRHWGHFIGDSASQEQVPGYPRGVGEGVQLNVQGAQVHQARLRRIGAIDHGPGARQLKQKLKKKECCNMSSLDNLPASIGFMYVLQNTSSLDILLCGIGVPDFQK